MAKDTKNEQRVEATAVTAGGLEMAIRQRARQLIDAIVEEELEQALGAAPSVRRRGDADGLSPWDARANVDDESRTHDVCDAPGYSTSSSTAHPAIRIASRAVGDPLGELSAEVSMIEGGGSQLANLSRWGDYSAMTIDPVDNCTFCYTDEYLKANGTFNWSTRIGSFKMSSCF